MHLHSKSVLDIGWAENDNTHLFDIWMTSL